MRNPPRHSKTPGPSEVELLYEEALRAFAAGDLARSKQRCLELVARAPRHGEAWVRLAHIAHREGELRDAAQLYARAIELLDTPTQAHHNLAVVSQQLGDGDAALRHYLAAEARGLRSPQLHSNLGALLRSQRRLAEAETQLQRALALDPRSAEAHTNLGITLSQQGRLREAMPHLLEAVALAPALAVAHDNLLLNAHYWDLLPPEQLADLARHYGRVQASSVPQRARPRRPALAGRRLRVGFVSGDLRQHSVSYFLAPLLEHRDRAQVDYHVYSDVAAPDGVTEALRANVDVWREVFGLPDARLLALVESDALDVLVDLSGHTANNRLRLFAARAAPVQVSYLGYPGTTGLATMDFRVTDAWADPPGRTEALHTETLLRMPNGFLCYRPPREAPPVAAAPKARKGFVTFGCFNNLAKVSPTIIALWARVLAQVPDARLVLKNMALADPSTERALRARLADGGLEDSRVELHAPTPGEVAHLASYEALDVALDTYPYHGTTTTCEALWMGVPVVTLLGAAHHSRVGASLMEPLGLPGLVAETPDTYVASAVALARDWRRLEMLRDSLRGRLGAAPLRDEVAQARAFEALLREAVHRVSEAEGSWGQT
jgi:protein O-GlcNAc transferase